MEIQDLKSAVKTTLSDHHENFDLDGIVQEIVATYGEDIVSLDVISNGEYFRLVQRHAR